MPDVVTLAKGLGGGLPIGATIARADLSFGPGDHASTFGPGPIPCAGALAVLAAIERDGLLENARVMGERLIAGLSSLTGRGVVEVRGRGLLIGVQLERPVAHEVVLAMIEEGVLATEAGPDVVRMSPPLVVGPLECDMALSALTAALTRARVAAEVSS